MTSENGRRDVYLGADERNQEKLHNELDTRSDDESTGSPEVIVRVNFDFERRIAVRVSITC